MRKVNSFLVIALSLIFVACGGGGADRGTESVGGEVIGSAVRGEELYSRTTIGSASAPGCITCHSLEPGVQLVGPSHAGVASRAEAAVPGTSSADFLRESIIEPDAHVTDGFAKGLMYQNYGSDLSEQEVADLVAFLLTLK